MLKPIYSFYQNTLAPIAQKGWEKIPTDKVSDFFHKIVPTFAQSSWERFSSYKIPSPKKVALFTAGLFVAYKIYQSFQSLNTRLSNLEKDNQALKNRIKALEEAKSNLERKIATLEKDFADLEDIQMHSFDEELSEENEIPEQPPKQAQQIVAYDGKTALDTLVEKLKTTFPGKHIELNADKNRFTLADFLLQTLFRIEDITAVEFHQESQTFKLSYDSHQIVRVTQLPQIVWDRMPYVIQGIVAPLLKTSPAAQISESITVTFTKTDQGIVMAFDAGAFTLSPNALGYTAHLKSIIIPQNPQDDLIVHSEHNSKVGKKVGHVEALLFVEILQLNLQQGRQIVE